MHPPPTPPQRLTWAQWLGILIPCAFVILLFAGIVLPRLLSGEDRGPRPELTKIAMFVTILHLYKMDNGHYPTTEQGLQALVEKPTRPPLARKWLRYIEAPSVPLDPWGRPYLYRCPGENGAPFTILSYGSDGRPRGEDDAMDIESSMVFR